MRRPIRLFVSASADLAAERDAIGRLAAAMPLALGWEIGRSASPAADPADATVHVGPHDCDLYIFVLGRDITAPAGAEWDAALSVQHPVLALLKRVPRTPAGLVFQGLGLGRWTPYSSRGEFERIVRFWLVRQLLDGQERFGLLLAEVEGLIGLIAGLERAPDAEPGPGDYSAGGAGVILPTLAE